MVHSMVIVSQIHCNFPRRGDGFANHFLVIVWMRCRRNSLLARHEERGATSCRTDSLMASSVCRFNGAFCAVCSACWQRIGVGAAATTNAGRQFAEIAVIQSANVRRSQLLNIHCVAHGIFKMRAPAFFRLWRKMKGDKDFVMLKRHFARPGVKAINRTKRTPRGEWSSSFAS